MESVYTPHAVAWYQLLGYKYGVNRELVLTDNKDINMNILINLYTIQNLILVWK